MLAYNKEGIDNLAIVRQAGKWRKQNLISPEEFNSINEKHFTFYTDHNIFSRIGMFIFTLVVISAAFGIFTLVTELKAALIQLICFAVICTYAAENLFRNRHYFRSGVSDALIYSALLLLTFIVVMIVDSNDINFRADTLFYLAGITPFIIIASTRYADSFLAAISFTLIIWINALILFKFGDAGKLLLPFETMIISMMIYISFRKLGKKNQLRYWSHCIATIETLSIVTFYLAGNYFVVRSLSEVLLGAEYLPGTDIAFSWFFYAFTILTPAILILAGLRKKDYILLRAGILLEAVGVLSIKYYYSFMPIELALMLAGVIIVLIAWISMRYLKSPCFGITTEDDEARDKEALTVLGSIVVAQATSNLRPTESQPNRFGGGETGGGGAGSEY
jgi:hypothetical protein